ncbi:uncharacterized protein EI90DRAFT_3124702 [Cantharellus anzutake]|uniref:uncharacterized protein n=1 Tax=Cantharellus anzutake TaxID=1750568 RepID=UPI0019043D8D|nr:uncharacterized protein EI90DRAFT_3124702 [Cantharellus anzutake]KAF8330208.1 hypothetical protein EI90DRAFT_3124702 [Cantharellus anzutake]
MSHSFAMFLSLSAFIITITFTPTAISTSLASFVPQQWVGPFLESTLPPSHLKIFRIHEPYLSSPQSNNVSPTHDTTENDSNEAIISRDDLGTSSRPVRGSRGHLSDGSDAGPTKI